LALVAPAGLGFGKRQRYPRATEAQRRIERHRDVLGQEVDQLFVVRQPARHDDQSE
jgi:hypothetical protein